MVNAKESYPVDLLGIKELGIRKWLDNYYVPFRGEELHNIATNILDAYFLTLKQFDNEVLHWLAISKMRIVNDVYYNYLSILMLTRLQDRGFRYIISRDKREIHKLLLDEDPLKLINFNKLVKDELTSLTFRKKTENVIRLIKSNMSALKFDNWNFIKNISGPYFMIGDRYTPEAYSYCTEKDIYPICLPVMLFSGNRKGNSLTSNEKILVSQFIQCFMDSIKQTIPAISELTSKYLKNSLCEYFEYGMLFLKQNIYFLRKLRKLKRKTLLATSLGYPRNRLFCAAWRIAGGEVIGFTHGNNICINYNQTIIYDGACIANYVVTTSSSQKIVYNHFVEKFTNKYKDNLKIAEITNLTKGHYRPIFAELQKESSVDKINKVMVVGYPKPFFFYPWYPEHNIFTSLYVDIHVVKILKKAGFYVIYKPHPITMNEAEDIFKDYVDDVVKEKFEKVINLADCILFNESNSTTFKYSLLSKKPLVLINVRGKLWYPRVLELLKKRCCLVDAYPADGRIVFDERELVKAVESSINNIDYELLCEFAF